MIGRIHSLETFGTLDGPGIRFVLFLQGCALRCRFCHNPDTWDTEGGKEMSVDEVLAEIEPYIHYYKASGGGITVSGGEPTLQAPFVAALFKACKERWNLHTALDSSGFCDPDRANDLLQYTDLVLLDLKEMDSAKHKDLTSQPNDRIHRFARHLAEIKKPIWIRCVLVPDVTDHEEHWLAVGQFVEQLGNVEKIEVLPYHKMGVYKWKQLNLPYTLEHIREGNEQDVERACRIIEEGRRSAGRLTSPNLQA